MKINHIVHRLRETRVLENYSFMTALSIFSALIGLIIYPYVIRVTGKEAYGTYVYALTIASFFQILLDFGFLSPCAKAIVQARNDIREQCRIVTSVLVSKAVFLLLCSVLFIAGVAFIPFMRTNWLLCLLCYIQVIGSSFFPSWYFQGLKKMKVVTYINLCLRLATIPFILLFVHSARDIGVYALIVMVSIVSGTIIAYSCLVFDGIRLRRISFERVRVLITDCTPFFATAITCELKSLTTKTIIKQFFGVGEVAIYDFAEKIVNIARLFTQNINDALFPEVVDNAPKQRVHKILRYERIIGLAFCALVILFSYPATLILGGKEMMNAVSVMIIFSVTIYTSLIAGAYINFVFIPSHRYYLIAINQLIALVSCVLISLVGLLVWRDVNVIAFGLALSGFVEIVFCRYLAKKIA